MIELSRRAFLAALGAIGLGTLVGCGGGGGGSSIDKTSMYRLSVLSRRASNASKANAANKRFATRRDALQGLAHPGDPAVPVQLDCKEEVWERLFGDGTRVVDLRSLADKSGIP